MPIWSSIFSIGYFNAIASFKCIIIIRLNTVKNYTCPNKLITCVFLQIIFIEN